MLNFWRFYSKLLVFSYKKQIQWNIDKTKPLILHKIVEVYKKLNFYSGCWVPLEIGKIFI